jgi:hypothetical protein
MVESLGAFDDQNSRSSTQYLLLTVTVGMRVVPIKTGRLRYGYAEAIFKSLRASREGGMKHIVLVT